MRMEAPAESGSTISNADSNWEDAEASTSSAPRRPAVCNVNGKCVAGWPSPRSARQPAPARASSRPAMGRARIASSPSISYTPPGASAKKAVRKRAAVPALPTCSRACAFGMRPPRPRMRMVWAASSAETAKPRACRAAMRMRVSRLKSAPVNNVSPSASAASNRARLVMLFEPGTCATPRAGVRKGVIVRVGLMPGGLGLGAARARRPAAGGLFPRRRLRGPAGAGPSGIRRRGGQQ